MKKTLLGTSALAGAALAAGTAFAAEPPTLTVSGGMAYDLVWHSGDQPANGTGLNLTANEQQGELHWRVRGVADNGLEYGFMIDYRYMNGGSAAGTFDETWMDFSGSWGRLYIGAEDGATDLVAGTHGNAVQVGTWGFDGNNASRHIRGYGGGALDNDGTFNTALHYYKSHAGMTVDQNKIGYTSPSFGGFVVGASYAPNGTEGQQASRDRHNRDNAVELAARWSGNFEDVSIRVDGGYGFADDNSGIGGVERHDVRAWMVGARVGFAGFQVAAGYLDNRKSNCVRNIGCDAGKGWDLGASYSFGPGAVSAYYGEARDDTNGNGFKDKTTNFHLGFQYRIAEGLTAHANWYNVRMDHNGGNSNPANAPGAATNKANVLILGSRITF